MKLKTLVHRLDDASGELGLILGKLEMEQRRGSPVLAEEFDFIEELYRKLLGLDVLPWRNRVFYALVPGLVLGALAVTLPPPAPRTWLAAAGGALVLAALAFAVAFTRKRKNLDARFRAFRAALQAGKSIFELGDMGEL